MRTFEFRRHSIKDGATSQMIGPRGHALAYAVGERQLRGKGFTHFFCSQRWRTQQSLASHCLGAGDMRLKHVPEHAPIYVELPGVQEMFRTCAAAEKRGESILATALGRYPDLCRDLGRAMKDAFDAWNELLPPDAKILVIGHSPSLEILAMADGREVASLKECQGYRVHVEDVGRKEWRMRYDFTSEDLDPSAIRAELKLDEVA